MSTKFTLDFSSNNTSLPVLSGDFKASGLQGAYRFYGSSLQERMLDLSGNGRHLAIITSSANPTGIVTLTNGVICGNGAGFNTGIIASLNQTILAIARPIQTGFTTAVLGFVAGEYNDNIANALYGDSLYYAESSGSNSSFPRLFHGIKDASNNQVSTQTNVFNGVNADRVLYNFWGGAWGGTTNVRSAFYPRLQGAGSVDTTFANNGLSQRLLTKPDTQPYTHFIGLSGSTARNDGDPDSRMEILEVLFYNRVLTGPEVFEQYVSSKAWWASRGVTI